MKKIRIFLIFAISLLFASCGPNKPDNKIHGTDVVAAGWKYDSTLGKNVQQMDTLVMVSPTWGQANHYASERADYEVWMWIAGILLALAIVAFYGKATEASWFPDISPIAFGALLFVLLSGSLASWKWQASSIRWNNDKFVPKVQYDAAMKATGTTQPIWDSLRNECRITWGPYECYTKKK